MMEAPLFGILQITLLVGFFKKADNCIKNLKAINEKEG